MNGKARLVSILQVVLPALLLGVALYGGFRSLGPLPPLGTFLHPTAGIWAVAAQRELPGGTVRIPGVTDSVTVVFDNRAVPHIFARNVEDAYRALGYLHARFRLFQLELTTRAAAGRLAEWFGKSALACDSEQRALGLAWSARRDAAALDSTSEEGRQLIAYADGVNAWIDAMGPADLPLEYRLLNAKPERWNPYRTFLFSKRMSYTLAYSHPDRTYARLVERVGRAAADALIGEAARIHEPVIPTGRDSPRVDLRPLPAPAPAPAPVLGDAATTLPRDGALPSHRRTDREASNNWAVAPQRTANGYALLAGDPHLDLTLPSVWYEAHLVVPEALDVYGVTFPGAPGVLIGFNRDVAWSFTNTGADVLDYYAETLDNLDRPTQYELDGVWIPLKREIEEYFGPHGKLLATDTLYYTHRGPLRRDSLGARSVRWTVLDQEVGLRPFLDMIDARSVGDWLGAMEFHLAPIQNGVVADRSGEIAMFLPGAYPIRPGGRAGFTLFDGSTSSSDWQGFLPVSRYPLSRNPEQGFLVSANQQPVDPATDSTYFGARWPAPWRAMRINQLLRADSAVTPDAMRRYQVDPGSARVEQFLPAMLSAVESASPALVGSEAIEAARLLGEWDGQYVPDNERAVLFELVLGALKDATWDELLVPGDTLGRRVMTPGEDVLAVLLGDPTSVWWDDRRTAETVESRDAVIVASLIAGYREAIERYGEPADGGWRWGRVGTANIYHLLRFSSLSALDLPVRGGRGTIPQMSERGTHGPSWRMVVELGPEVRAWGVYPGGQSGNPTSRWYKDRLQLWADGGLDPLPFPRTAAELARETTAGSFTIRSVRP